MKDMNSEYIAFLPIGMTFIILGLTADNMWSFLPIGLVFFAIALTNGFSNDKTEDEQTDENSSENVGTKNNETPDTANPEDKKDQ